MQYLFATSTDFTATLELPVVGEMLGGMGIWKGVVIAIWFGISQALIGLNVQVSFTCLVVVLLFNCS